MRNPANRRMDSKRREELDKHTQRMTEDRVVRVVIDNIPNGRVPERPKKRWSDSLSSRKKLSA
jgi:hypothetical protein